MSDTMSEEDPVSPAALLLIQQGKAANRQEAEEMLKRLEAADELEGGEPEDGLDDIEIDPDVET